MTAAKRYRDPREPRNHLSLRQKSILAVLALRLVQLVGMSIDLRAVVRAVGGTCVPHRLPDYTPVDSLSTLQEYVVVGSAAFATLVTGPVDQLFDRLDSGSEAAQVTANAVFVSGADGRQLRALLEKHRMTAILGAGRTAARASTDGSTTVRASVDAQAALHARVAALIAEDQAASDRLVTTGTKVLTKVARQGGPTAVIAELAHRIDGWAVLLDAHGQPITTAGAGRLHVDDAAAVALGRPVRVRHTGLQVHQVGSDRDLTGYLVISSRSAVTSRNRDLASQAAALFDLLLRTHDPTRTERLGREALIGNLLAGGSGAATLLRRWGVREASLTAFHVGARTRTVDLERLVARWLGELGAEHIFIGESGRLRGFIPDDLSEELAARVAAFTSQGGGPVHLGLGLPAPVELLRRSAIQAGQALDSALADGRRVLRYAGLPTVELVLDSLAAESTSQLAAALDGLRDENGEHGQLTETLFVFLSSHGGHRASASRLSIHRQTLSARIKRIEDLTNLSMHRPDDRAAAWLALRALGVPIQQEFNRSR